MPRTKVSKSSKRNREVSYREDKIREFETAFEEFENKLNIKAMGQITDIEGLVQMIISRTSKALLQMPVGVMFDNDFNSFTDWKQDSTLTASTSTLMRSTKVSNPNDEGYLTEDSSASGGGGSSQLLRPLQTHNYQQQQQQQRGFTPAGPLSSARLRRPRRSRSACGDYVPPGSAIKPKPSASEHMSRNKLRTPMASRTKALSADRSSQAAFMAAQGLATPPHSPPAAFMRWPKPGEMVLSMCGSPVVAQVMPDRFANVNIPVKNGVLSLRPKKLNDLKQDLLDSIDPETLKQIKTLHANLDMIVNMADKGYNK